MINLLTKINIIDNSGPIEGRCIKLYRPAGAGRPARAGDKILISVTKLFKGQEGKIKKGDKFKALIVRTKKEKYLRWEENAAVLITIKDKKTQESVPIGTRIKGPISGELLKRRKEIKSEKILALAKIVSPLSNQAHNSK